MARGRDALEHLMAGAAAVQVGTANLLNPPLALKVLENPRRNQRRTGVDGGAAWNHRPLTHKTRPGHP